ncbi:glycosyltransferase family 2 protein [Winogradskyella ursingii]|uniref:glycosyltransferase family 2 protein n=1 Tax=Winogradskyella ursingii TaxID=2686079 RepID=UPI0015CA41F4|nr:glycosyltransferase family 2 protein [Winogradskyella ursingii]
MLETKDIAIVILNWNGKNLLKQFLPSVISYSQNAMIYVADNASTDDSVAFVSATYPSIKIIKNSENGGYAKGYNDALKYVAEPIFCLLNSDVEVTENWLQPIVNQFNEDSGTAIIQPKILDYNNKDYFEYAGAAGGFVDHYGYPYCRGRIFNTIEKDEGQYNDISPIFWASGACLFTRKSIFEELKGFDESFFAHMEEIDLCWRAYNKNYKTVYVGTTSIYHVGGATLKNTNPRKTFLNFRNSLSTLVKNAHGSIYWKALARMILDAVAFFMFLFQLKPMHAFSILKAHISFYAQLPIILKKRNNSSQRAHYSDSKSIVWSYFISKRRRF